MTSHEPEHARLSQDMGDAPSTPVPNEPALEPPSAPFVTHPESSASPTPLSPRDSYALSGTSTPGLLEKEVGGSSENGTRNDEEINEKVPAAAARRPIWKRWWFWVAAAALLAVVVVAVVVPVVLTVGKHKGGSTPGAGSGPVGSGQGNPQSPTGQTSGGNGSIVITEDGSTFTYINPFGGFWVQDPADPFNNNARPNSWTAPLNTTWDFGTTRIYGVNLGGWFVMEPFITPAYYEKYTGAVDEWTLSMAMLNDTSSGGLSQLETHYNTFITEQDFAEIAGAGLNWIRLPIPFWCIDTWNNEPFLAKVSWKYILRALGWARKYGLRVNLDLHTIPGSQNGYNHSGKLGPINFLNGIMGIANAQRTLNYIRIITEFISQPEYQPVVPMFGIVNEPLLGIIGQDQLTRFYLQAYNLIRSITGIGAGHGPYISIHDGFQSLTIWKDFLPGADRFVLDTHPYFAFGGMAQSPIATGTGIEAGGMWPKQACLSWGGGQNQSQLDFGVTIAGEFSNGFNPCGVMLQGVGDVEPDYCPFYEDSSQWNATVKAGVMNFALASMDALQNWFFWTWKIANSTVTNTVGSPLWSYQLGLQEGWMPTDPRQAIGMCGALGATVGAVQFNYTYQPWQTGGPGAGTIDPVVSASYSQWPPLSLSGLPAPADATEIPMYTATAPIETLPPSTITGAATKTITEDGWADPSDTAPGVTAMAGCSYPDPWGQPMLTLPPYCRGPARKREAAASPAMITPPPAVI
ncbi:glycoside hydrolase family 5 protein [Jaapia argillacea MUCL 33604]|uniref:glucan 1,3-beta-glucosidase n=1 Tax=Jaapia argillacea MUCL 33604 TaxID=933084 RepID=A0A067PYY8_9AGAM|nr:glycoside hydrolase family 5 protein [Jaapia argillacea MUCL 33604]